MNASACNAASYYCREKRRIWVGLSATDEYLATLALEAPETIELRFLSSPSCTNESLVASFPRLEYLAFPGGEDVAVPACDGRSVARLAQLRELEVGKCKIGDDDIAQLDNLRSLDLGDSEISDEGIARVKYLNYLNLRRNFKVTDAGLARCMELRILYVAYGTTITGECLANIPFLYELETGESRIAFKYLCGLPFLEILRIFHPEWYSSDELAARKTMYEYVEF